MFKKLKIKFLLINMSLLTAVFIGIFGTIYLSTAYSMEKDMRMQLWSNIMIAPQQKPTPKNDRMDMTIKIDLDNTNEVVTVSSKMNTDDLDINNIVTKVINSSKDMDTIKINGESFGYLRQDIGNGKRIVLMSKSFQHEMLWNLLKIFIGVGSLSLILLFFISIYFTNKAINPLEETFRKQKQFIADASHELRTPLNVILSIEQLISSLTKSGVQISIEKMDTYMSTLKGNSQRLLNLINNIIDTSKIDSGFYRLDKEEVNIVTLVEDTALSMVELAEVKGLEIIIDPEIEELFINCDKLDIERCIINLIGNAIKFTDVGGTITVSICELEGKVKIGVKDTGIGIDEKYHKNIFDRFGQVNSVSSEVFGGSGLGLTLTKNLINLHGGEITVISEIGKGSEFSIILPIQE